MTKQETQNQTLNKTISIVAATAVSVLLFSFLAAPFVRVFSSTAKSTVFWLVGLLLTAGLYVFNLSIASIYVGAIWMTLGLYSEFEKRGTSWKKTSLLALISGFVFATVYFLILKKTHADFSEITKTILSPLETALTSRMAVTEVIDLKLDRYIPGLFLSLLTMTIGLGLIFETQIYNLLKLKREKIVASMKWIEFKVSDIFIWATLTSFLFSLVDFKNSDLKTAAINLAIVCCVILFFQGIAIIEYMLRFYRFGLLGKWSVYLFILGWFGPAVMFLGLTDYWMDYRKKLRLKLK